MRMLLLLLLLAGLRLARGAGAGRHGSLPQTQSQDNRIRIIAVSSTIAAADRVEQIADLNADDDRQAADEDACLEISDFSDVSGVCGGIRLLDVPAALHFVGQIRYIQREEKIHDQQRQLEYDNANVVR